MKNKIKISIGYKNQIKGYHKERQTQAKKYRSRKFYAIVWILKGQHERRERWQWGLIWINNRKNKLYRWHIFLEWILNLRMTIIFIYV